MAGRDIIARKLELFLRAEQTARHDRINRNKYSRKLAPQPDRENARFRSLSLINPLIIGRGGCSMITVVIKIYSPDVTTIQRHWIHVVNLHRKLTLVRGWGDASRIKHFWRYRIILNCISKKVSFLVYMQFHGFELFSCF